MQFDARRARIVAPDLDLAHGDGTQSHSERLHHRLFGLELHHPLQGAGRRRQDVIERDFAAGYGDELLRVDTLSVHDKFALLPRVLPFIILLTGVMVALYGGYATPSETAGLGAVLALVLIASITGVAGGLILRMRGKLDEAGYIPFGPFLAFAGLWVMVYGPLPALHL